MHMEMGSAATAGNLIYQNHYLGQCSPFLLLKRALVFKSKSFSIPTCPKLVFTDTFRG